MNQCDAGQATMLAEPSSMPIDPRGITTRRCDRWIALLWIVLAGISGTLVFEINAIGADDNAWHTGAPNSSVFNSSQGAGGWITAVGKTRGTP